MEGKHSFDYECLYPFAGIKSTYFNEDFDFFKNQRKIKICLESVFHTIHRLKEIESENSKIRINYLKNLEGIHAVVLSKDLFEYLENIILTHHHLICIKKTEGIEESSYLYETIYDSTIKDINFYTDSNKLLTSENLEIIKKENFQEWLRQFLTEFYFIRNYNTEPSNHYRNLLFAEITGQKKLSMFKKKINTNNESYFDDLLQLWWQNRY